MYHCHHLLIIGVNRPSIQRSSVPHPSLVLLRPMSRRSFFNLESVTRPTEHPFPRSIILKRIRPALQALLPARLLVLAPLTLRYASCRPSAAYGVLTSLFIVPGGSNPQSKQQRVIAE